MFTRVYVAVPGVSLVRKRRYWSRVCSELGFKSGETMNYVLSKEDRAYDRRREQAMPLTGKKRRQKTILGRSSV